MRGRRSRSTRALTLVGALFALSLWGSIALAVPHWSAAPAMIKPVINTPKPFTAYATDEHVDFNCTRSVDYDTYTDEAPPCQELDAMDSLVYYPEWGCSAGIWEGDDNKGTDVTWIAPSEATTGIIISVNTVDVISPPIIARARGR